MKERRSSTAYGTNSNNASLSQRTTFAEWQTPGLTLSLRLIPRILFELSMNY